MSCPHLKNNDVRKDFNALVKRLGGKELLKEHVADRESYKKGLSQPELDAYHRAYFYWNEHQGKATTINAYLDEFEKGGIPTPEQARELLKAPTMGEPLRSEPPRVKGDTVEGLKVRKEVPNTSSISASLADYEELPGIREVPMSEFHLTGRSYSASETKWIQNLAEEIKASGEISPLIIVRDKQGYYILEGGHRAEALFLLGKKAMPAVVVDDLSGEGPQFQKAVDQPPLEGMTYEMAVGGAQPQFSKMREPAPAFYSPTLRAVESLKQDRGTGDQMWAMISKAPGVKKSELDWMGLEEWLKGKGKVTKQEIADFLRSNQVEVVEVISNKGDLPRGAATMDERRERAAQKLYTKSWDDLNGDQRSLASKAANIASTKYAQYVLPGEKGTYRELLFTMPATAKGWLGKRGEFKGWYDPSISDEAKNAIEASGDRLQDIPLDSGNRVYTSPHWSEKNIFAHARFEDRTGPNGERVLFVEEIQSDWGVAARKEGFRQKLTQEEENQKKELTEHRNYLTETRRNYGKGTPQEKELTAELDRNGALLDTLLEKQKGVPPNPFLSNWHEYVLKNLLRKAAEEGYDRLAWINGEQTAARYDLSKQIERVTYNPSSEALAAYDHTGKKVIEKFAEPGKVADYIGKDAAQKLLNSPLTEANPAFPGTTYHTTYHTLEGAGLKAGGEWAVNLYDVKLPQFLSKYGKKWQAQVESIVLGEPSKTSYRVIGADGSVIGKYSRKGVAEEEAGKFRGSKVVEEPTATVADEIGMQQSIPITPAMKESVLYEGQPLFSKQRNAAKEDELVQGAAKKLIREWVKYVETEAMNTEDVKAFIRGLRHKYGYVRDADIGERDYRDVLAKQGSKIVSDEEIEGSGFVGTWLRGSAHEVVVEENGKRNYLYVLPEQADVDSFNTHILRTERKLYKDDYAKLLYYVTGRTNWAMDEVQVEEQTLPSLMREARKKVSPGGGFAETPPHYATMMAAYHAILENPYWADATEKNFDTIKNQYINTKREVFDTYNKRATDKDDYGEVYVPDLTRQYDADGELDSSMGSAPMRINLRRHGVSDIPDLFKKKFNDRWSEYETKHNLPTGASFDRLHKLIGKVLKNQQDNPFVIEEAWLVGLKDKNDIPERQLFNVNKQKEVRSRPENKHTFDVDLIVKEETDWTNKNKANILAAAKKVRTMVETAKESGTPLFSKQRNAAKEIDSLKKRVDWMKDREGPADDNTFKALRVGRAKLERVLKDWTEPKGDIELWKNKKARDPLVKAINDFADQIGLRGYTGMRMRTLLEAAKTKEDMKAVVDVIDQALNKKKIADLQAVARAQELHQALPAIDYPPGIFKIPEPRDAQTLPGEISVEPEPRASEPVKPSGDKTLLSLVKGYINTIRANPKYDGFTETLLTWNTMLQQTHFSSEKGQKFVKKAVPDKQRREAISVYRDAGGDMDTLKKWASETKSPRLRRKYELAQRLTERQKAMVVVLGDVWDRYLEFATSLGIVDQGRENYVTHLVDTSGIGGGGRIGSQSKLMSYFRFAKRAKYPTIFDLEQAGLKMATTDVADILGVYSSELGKVVATRWFMKNLTQTNAQDGRPLAVVKGGMTMKEKPEGVSEAYFIRAEQVDKEHIGYKGVNHWAMLGWKYLGKDAEGKPVWMEGELIFHPDVAKHIERVLARDAISDWYNNWDTKNLWLPFKIPLKALSMAQAAEKQLMFGLSGFHWVTEGTHGALGHRVNPFSGIPKIDLENNARHLWWAQHGCQLWSDEGGRWNFQQGLTSGPLLHQIPGIGKYLEAWSDLLFKWYIPGLKLKAAEATLRRYKKLYRKELETGTITEDDLALHISQMVNNSFGIQNFALLGRSRTVQHALRMFVVAPDFSESRLKNVAQAAVGLVAKKNREQLEGMALLAGTLFFGCAILNMLLNDGDPHIDEPFRVIHKNKMYSLRSLPGDFLNAIKHTWQFAAGRASPIIGRAGLWIASGHRDYRGQPESFWKLLGEMLVAGVPISLRGGAQKTMEWLPAPVRIHMPDIQTNKDIDLWEQFLTATGVQVSRYSPMTTMYDKVAKWRKDNGLPSSDAGSLPLGQYRDLRNSLQDGNFNKARRDWEDLKAKHPDKAEKELSDGFMASCHKPFTGSMETDLKFYQSLNPYDRHVFDSARSDRINCWRKFQEMMSTPEDRPGDRPDLEEPIALTPESELDYVAAKGLVGGKWQERMSALKYYQGLTPDQRQQFESLHPEASKDAEKARRYLYGEPTTEMQKDFTFTRGGLKRGFTVQRKKAEVELSRVKINQKQYDERITQIGEEEAEFQKSAGTLAP